MDDEYDQEKAFQEELAKINDETTKIKLKKIKDLVLSRINLEKKFSKEQCQLEAQYEAKYAPLYRERSEIIKGNKQCNYNELKDVLPDVKVGSEESKEVGIPNYWLTCLKNSSQFGDLINEKDEKILSHLTDITIDYEPNGNFSLSFHFSPNEFFDHTVLTREFFMDEKNHISKIESTKIEWKSQEANPTISQKKKKVKAKGKSEIKTIMKTEEVESFFTFFKCYTAEGLNKKIEKNDEDEDKEEDENMYIDEEYDLGTFIKDELIPYSLEYYLDIVDEEDNEEFEDEEDEDEEEEEDRKPKKVKKPLFN